MKIKTFTALCFIVMSLIIGCSANSSSDEQNNKTSSPVSDQISAAAEEDNSSVTEIDSINNNLLIPSFLYGFFDYGTYNTPSRIPNPDNYDEIGVSANDTLVFPELSVLAIVVDKWGYSPYLMTQDDVKIGQLFDFIKSVKVQKKIASETGSTTVEAEQDSEISIVLLTGSADYALMVLRSFKDGSIDIRIEQENKAEVIMFTTNSDTVHEYLREICGIQSGDLQLLLNATSIGYLSEDEEWISLSDGLLKELQSLATSMTQIPNYSSGCPFDLRVVIDVNGEKHNAVISTDSCGILIIGDQTYQLDKEQRDILRAIFNDAPWGSE